MKNAMEIAQLTKTSEVKLIADRHDTTMNYINNTMAREVEKQANLGKLEAKFRVSEKIDRDTVKRVFTVQGFEVNVKGYEVRISWMHQYFNL